MVNFNEANLTWLLKEALKLEIRGKEFFLHAARLTNNELGRKMFNHLAEEEVKHMETFTRLFTEVLGSEKWKKEISAEDLKENSEVIERLVARIKGAAGKSDLEALSIGLELERKAIEHFQQAVAASAGEKTKQIFEKIASEERYHYDLLQAQLDSLQNNGFWLDWAEFKMDGKY